MKNVCDFFKKRKSIDFENDLYNKVESLCFELFGDVSVIPDKRRDMITVVYPVSLSITFSRIENKMYFFNFADPDAVLLRSENCLDHDFLMIQKSFRVFDYESAEKYLRFKKQESDLIGEIEG
jgi:hypothetical protein